MKANGWNVLFLIYERDCAHLSLKDAYIIIQIGKDSEKELCKLLVSPLNFKSELKFLRLYNLDHLYVIEMEFDLDRVWCWLWSPDP